MEVMDRFLGMFKRKKIDYLVTTRGLCYTRCNYGEFRQKPSSPDGVGYDECVIKHIGNQIYLIGEFDFYKQGYSTHGVQERANRFFLLFPSKIASVHYE